MYFTCCWITYEYSQFTIRRTPWDSHWVSDREKSILQRVRHSTPILLWQADAFFSLKTMDRWQSVFCYPEHRRGPLKLWHYGFHIQGLPTLVKDLRQYFHICWFPIPRSISSQKGFQTRKNIIMIAGTNNKLKFVSYCKHLLIQCGLRHRPVKERRKLEHCKEGEVICK